MIREKISHDFKSQNVFQNIDGIKGYFERNGAICTTTDSSTYEYVYKHNFKDKISTLLCSFNLKAENAEIKLTANVDNEENSIYEIDDLLNKLFADLMIILFGGKEKYVIRVYGRYYLASPLKLNNTFNWKVNINLMSHLIPGREQVYNIDGITVCPKEQIMFSDIEVNAYNLSAARSIAYNLFLEFIALLSVSLDLGFEPYTTRENILLFDQKTGQNSYNFVGTVASNGIDDQELNLFVFDNMNGLIAINEKTEMVLNNYLNISFNDTVVTQSSYNEILDNIFRQRKFVKHKNQLKHGEISEDIMFYNLSSGIVTEHCSFFRKVVAFEKTNKVEYDCFLNACKLYNHAHCSCSMNPTAMLSYFIASVEALSKSEKSREYMQQATSDMDRFTSFCERYYTCSKNEFDKKFYKYIYGKIRSAHFHSGESCFFEYNCNLDLSFNEDFFQMQNLLLRARMELRSIIIRWVKVNILKSDD